MYISRFLHGLILARSRYLPQNKNVDISDNIFAEYPVYLNLYLPFFDTRSLGSHTPWIGF